MRFLFLICKSIQGHLLVCAVFIGNQAAFHWFAAGDVVHGSLTVVHAVNDAKNAAAAMMRYMKSNG